MQHHEPRAAGVTETLQKEAGQGRPPAGDDCAESGSRRATGVGRGDGPVLPPPVPPARLSPGGRGIAVGGRRAGSAGRDGRGRDVAEEEPPLPADPARPSDGGGPGMPDCCCRLASSASCVERFSLLSGES